MSIAVHQNRFAKNYPKQALSCDSDKVNGETLAPFITARGVHHAPSAGSGPIGSVLNVGLTDQTLSCKPHSHARRTGGAPLAAMHKQLTLSVCKRRDAVRLALH
jgi:hypothetical protein